MKLHLSALSNSQRWSVQVLSPVKPQTAYRRELSQLLEKIGSANGWLGASPFMTKLTKPMRKVGPKSISLALQIEG